MTLLLLMLCGLALGAADTDYDPKRDATADLNAAMKQAQAEKKHILLDVGGKWCVWCRILDQFFVEHPKLLQLRDQNYVWLKVNFSPENQNEAFLGKYPKIASYPHLFVLDAKGALVRSQDTSELEDKRSYHEERMQKFLESWRPRPQ